MSRLGSWQDRASGMPKLSARNTHHPLRAIAEVVTMYILPRVLRRCAEMLVRRRGEEDVGGLGVEYLYVTV